MRSVFGTAVVAVTVGLTAVGCTGDGPPEAASTPSATPASAAGPALTVEEAYRKLPLDGTRDLPVSWELAGAPDSDEVLAARRGLALHYWLYQATDWIPIIQVGQIVYSDEYYQRVLAPYAVPTPAENPYVGPLWVKFMGAEKTGPDQTMVTFCTDLGHWHQAEDTDYQVREERANLESYVVERAATGDGEPRWVADRRLDNDTAREPKYGAECTKWAQHRP